MSRRSIAGSIVLVSALLCGPALVLRSTADRRERWGDAVAPGLVRFSAGCEDTGDLVDDVLGAIDAL